MKELPTLRLGNRGEDVKRLQRILRIKADGVFGWHTQLAVKVFQKTFLDAEMTGVVTPDLWPALVEKEPA